MMENREVYMAGYESLYTELSEAEKKLNSAIADAKKHASAIVKSTESGVFTKESKSYGNHFSYS